MMRGVSLRPYNFNGLALTLGTRLAVYQTSRATISRIPQKGLA